MIKLVDILHTCKGLTVAKLKDTDDDSEFIRIRHAYTDQCNVEYMSLNDAHCIAKFIMRTANENMDR